MKVLPRERQIVVLSASLRTSLHRVLNPSKCHFFRKIFTAYSRETFILKSKANEKQRVTLNCSDINFEGCNIDIVRGCENLLLCTGKATSYWKGHEKRNMCIFNFNNGIKSGILFSHGKDM